MICDQQEKGLPLWSEKIERLECIEWIYPIYFIYKQQNLNSFLEPCFYFDSSSEFYYKENHFAADKLRTHIGHKEGVMIYHIFVNINYQINA